MKSNIVLIGMPGCGKSTCGVVAAKMLLKNFFDTDLLIQNIEGMRLQNIIDDRGSTYFEEAEEKAILSLDLQGTVIATGGSVVYSEKSMEHLKNMGKIIYMHLDYEHMCERINDFATRGILIKKGSTLKDMYDERLPLYSEWADAVINCNNNSVEDTVAMIIKEAENNT